MSRKKNSEEKRNNIRHSAYLCFRESGYYQTSIDDICSTANISKGSFYWHYGAKIDVFIDILETWAREVIDELLEQFEAAAKNPDRIHMLSQAFEQEFHRARAIVPLWVEFSLLGRTDKEVQLSIGKFFRRARSAIAEILRETAHSHLSEPEIKASAGMILGSYIGITLQEYADNEVDASKWAQDFVGILRLIFHKRHLDSHPKDTAETKSKRAPSHRLVSILEGQQTTTIETYMAIRELLFSMQPQITERWIQGWNSIGYYHNGLICLLKIQKNDVILSFRKKIPLQKLKNLNLDISDKKKIIFNSTIDPRIKDILEPVFR